MQEGSSLHCWLGRWRKGPVIWTVFRSWTSALLTARKKPVSQWRNWTLPSTEMIRELHSHLQSLQKGAQPCQLLAMAFEFVSKGPTESEFWPCLKLWNLSQKMNTAALTASVFIGEVGVWCGWQAFFLAVQCMTKAKEPWRAQHWQRAFAKLY